MTIDTAKTYRYSAFILSDRNLPWENTLPLLARALGVEEADLMTALMPDSTIKSGTARTITVGDRELSVWHRYTMIADEVTITLTARVKR